MGLLEFVVGELEWALVLGTSYFGNFAKFHLMNLVGVGYERWMGGGGLREDLLGRLERHRYRGGLVW